MPVRTQRSRAAKSPASRPEWVRSQLQTAAPFLFTRDSFFTNLVVRVCLSHGGRPVSAGIAPHTPPSPDLAGESLVLARVSGMVLATISTTRRRMPTDFIE